MTKMSKGLAVIKQNTELLASNAVKKITRALMLSHLNLCPTVWSSGVIKHYYLRQRGNVSV